MNIKIYSLIIILSLLSQAAQAALLYYDLQTDASGNFVNPGTTGWAGDGTVVGPAGFGTTSGNTMVNDFSGTGVLTLGPVTPWGTSFMTPTTGTMTVTLGGSGTGDIAVNLSGPGGGKPAGFNVLDLKGGVTSVTVEINYTEPVSPAFDATTIPRTNQPFLAAFRTQNIGGAVDFNAEYLGLSHTTATTTPATFVSGLPAGVDSVDMSTNSFNWGSDTSFSGTSTNSRWQGIHLFDIDGDSAYEAPITGDGVVQDAEAIFATGIRFTFTPSDGDADGFLDGANFLFSTNGSQQEDTFAAAQEVVVPEPSSAALLSLCSMAIFLRRKRSRS